MPIVSVNPEADPPQPRTPVRPNRAEQDGETAEEKSQEHKRNTSKVETGTLSQDGGEEANESARRISGRQQRALAETALWRKSDGGVRSREVKGESVGQGQGKGGSDRDNLTDPGDLFRPAPRER